MFWRNTKFTTVCLGFAILLGGLYHQPVCAVTADDPDGCFDTTQNDGKDAFLKNLPSSYQLEQPLGSKAAVTNIGEYILLVYRYVLGIVGIIVTVLIMVGGFIWLSSAGNEQLITQGKEMITSAVIGLVITLFSYSILYWINPKFIMLDMKVFQIPIPEQTYQCQNIPNTVAIATTKGVNGNGRQACAGVVHKLEWLKENVLPEQCADCTIYIKSAYRDGNSQAALYSCYERSQVTGQCPEDCASCNETTKPCCSDHNKGMAIDVCLIAPGREGVLANSCDYLKTAYNNGGNGNNAAALRANQDLLKQIMVAANFKPYAEEWWHFTYLGHCNDILENDIKTCTPNAEGYANEYYCTVYEVLDYQTRSGASGGSTTYAKATCQNQLTSCQFSDIVGATLSERCSGYYEFDESPSNIVNSNEYLEKPECN